MVKLNHIFRSCLLLSAVPISNRKVDYVSAALKEKYQHMTK